MPIIYGVPLHPSPKSKIACIMAISIIDLACLAKGERAEVSKLIGSACRDWGAFYVKNHGVQIEDLMFEVKNFLNASVEHKQRAVPKMGYFGYFHKGGENTLGKKDCKEGLYLRAEYPNEKISENDIMPAWCQPRGPTPTGIQHKSFRIPIGIWNLDEESEIFSKMESSKIDSNSVISSHFHITPHIEAI